MSNPSWFRAVRSVLALASVLTIAGAASAQHFDMLYGVDDGHVKTGATDFDLLQLVPDVRVFAGSLNFNSGQGGIWTDDPGHTTNSSAPAGMSPMPAGADVYFDIAVEPLTGRNISYWDGDTYPISWGPVPNGETIEISYQSDLAIADGGTEPVTGFLIDSEPIHRHHDFHLRPTAGATSGIYLLALEASMVPLLPVDAAAPSPRYWIVFRYNEGSADWNAAIDWVEANLDVPDCQDGYDNDGDGLIDHDGGGQVNSDPGCDDALDESEFSLAFACDDGIDNDGDGLVDFPEEPGCGSLTDLSELFQCEDGLDNDGDELIDFPDDPQCTSAEWDREAPKGGCGLGAEIALLLPLLRSARRRGEARRAS